MKRLTLFTICVFLALSILMPVVSAADITTIKPSGLVVDIPTETISNVSSLMEYSTNGVRWISIKQDPLDISKMIPSASARDDVTLRIRYKAVTVGTAASLPSMSEEFVLKKRPAPPTAAAVRFNGLTDPESISVTDLMEFRPGTSGGFTQVPSGATRIPLEVGDTAQRFQVRFTAVGTAIDSEYSFASASRSLLIPARKAPPRAAYNGSEDSIKGVSTSMEYSIDGGATWTAVTGTAIPRSDIGSATEVLVRTKATEHVASSTPKVVTFPPASTETPAGLTPDYRREIVNGVNNYMEYSINNGARWTLIKANPLSLSNLIPSPGAKNDVTLLIRNIALSGNPASQPYNLLLPRRIPAPSANDVRFDGFTESIIAFDGMEYRAGTSGDYTAAPGSVAVTGIPVTLGVVSQRYQVRVAPTGSTFASAPRSVLVPARKAAPNASYDGSNDRIKSVTRNMEYSRDGGTTWIEITSATIPRSELGSGAAVILVRTAATRSAAASLAREISIPAESTTSPAAPTVNYRDETVSGVSDLMEYSINGTKWTSITSSDPLDISKLIPASSAREPVTLRLRYKAVPGSPGSPASQIVTIVLPKRPPTPTKTEIAFDGITESLIASSTSLLEYRLGTTAAFAAIPAGGVVPNVVGSAQQKYQVRVSASASDFASGVRILTIPARRSAPNAVYNAERDIISGVSSSMEYSVNGGATWEPITTSRLTRDDFGNSAVTVLVRARATTASASSAIKTVTVPSV